MGISLLMGMLCPTTSYENRDSACPSSIQERCTTM
jgi:hypothetical protein